ncbi:type I DNA topoisomerase [bacterium]|nr:type I DNA topoisomerase [bacterium]
MKLVIVESPSKSKTISKYLGPGYTVKASVGHVRDLPKSNKKAIDIDGGFVPHYEISKGKEKVIAELASLAKKSDEIILATDPDREGEAIAWHIADAIGVGSQNSKVKTQKLKRIVFHEITKDAVQEALAHPRAIDEDLRRAQEARRVLDRLVGYDLSELIWKKVRYGLSAGRVQSPALRILVEREREIKAFKPEIYFVITANAKNEKGENFLLTCGEQPKSRGEADRIEKIARENEWRIKDVKESEAKRAPYAPFSTSTLQQAASSRLGLSPSNTMRIAQKLYEAGLITYMRTDSANIGKDALSKIHALVKKEYGENFLEPRIYKTMAKNAQEAHEAIRPADISRMEAGAAADQKKLYRLIWRRTVASQMADAKMKKMKITANVSGDSIPDFSATGSRIVFDGWFAADPESGGKEIELPNVAITEKIMLIDIPSDENATEPPPRYSEAGLVKELEKRGIGRPSTYASIIKTIQDRGYVEKEGRALRPTDTGEVVSGFLEKHFGHIISDTFTAEMENELDEISRGERKYAKTLKEFYTPFRKLVESKENIEKLTSLGDAPTEFKCPVCGGAMEMKLGKSGVFMSCKKYPECVGARTREGEAMKGPEETGEDCPECGGKLVMRAGKYGSFVSCGNYPKCKFIKKDEKEEEKRKTGVACPLCNKGEMMERRGRFGIFYGCSNYPACKNAIKAKPTGRLCPDCGTLMMEGTKTIPERCSDKTCPNHNPHKKHNSSA